MPDNKLFINVTDKAGKAQVYEGKSAQAAAEFLAKHGDKAKAADIRLSRTQKGEGRALERRADGAKETDALLGDAGAWLEEAK